jgi:ABC-type multidrug transport system fused ATPase/permease subunit
MTGAGVGMMFFMSPELAFVGLSIVPPVALWAVFMGKKVKSLSKQVQSYEMRHYATPERGIMGFMPPAPR